MKKSASLLLLTLASLMSCGPKHVNLDPSTMIAGKYFSIRPQKSVGYVGIIQLKSPALLSEALMGDGKVVIDDEVKEALEKEQAEFIEKLKEISPKIKIVATYKLVLNGVAFYAPEETLKDIENLAGKKNFSQSSNFDRPQATQVKKSLENLLNNLNEKNSVTFIGADKFYKLGMTGKGIRVGIIDTGIDYTHVMLGGPGKKELYKEINPDLPNAYFPNEKVVGGKDFVGTKYAPSGATLEQQIPVKDPNPIDESGHGTHVAGTVAGIGDGVLTYSGVAPEAKLYALKVFGKDGGTSDVAVIQALEYAADPTETLNPANKLDVVNLSLGGGFGKPKIFYSEAVKNLTRIGTVVVASAGNSGDEPYITGAPATADEALSVAASIDDMPQNIKIPAAAITIGGATKLVELNEGDNTLPAKTSNITGPLVAIGSGAEPISDALKAQVKGKIALIDRGGKSAEGTPISFEDKFVLAESLGAIGVVVANNIPAEPVPMHSEKKFNFPATMISFEQSKEVKKALAEKKEVLFNFSSPETIDRSDLIDTITDFSSRGPRFTDSLIKPEIAGPGSKVISAAMGTGNEAVQMSGTSMSGPHLAGVMALMKQTFPKEKVDILKARLLNTSKILVDQKGNYIPVARQGAGRVRLEEVLKASVIATPPTLSLGEISVASKKVVAKNVTLINPTDKDVLFSARAIHSKNVSVSLPSAVKVKAKSSVIVPVSFTLARADASQNNIEADGFVIFTNAANKTVVSLPFLGILNKVSDITAADLITQTDSEIDKPGSQVRLTLRNKSKSSGDALIFNLLGEDEKKIVDPNNYNLSSACDLESAGIRIIDRVVEGKAIKSLQVGVKLYDTVTLWQPCDISLQIDANGDGIADQELLGINAGYVAGIPLAQVASILLDAKMARQIRAKYEADQGKKDPKTDKPLTVENYLPALMDINDMLFYNHSNVAVMEADLSRIVKGKNGKVRIKLSLTHFDANVGGDDFLGNHEKKWQTFNLTENALTFYEMPEVVTVKENDMEFVSMKRGLGNSRLLVLYPHNTPTSLKDRQSQILKEKMLK